MNRQDAVLSMPFAKLYALLVQKAIKKGRTRAEVGTVTGWLTGYTPEELKNAEESGLSYGDFFRQAPCLNPRLAEIRGAICGERVETIADPLWHAVRCLDKLIDGLAKGKPLTKLLPGFSEPVI